ncbi:MAG: hypothetical protein JWM12_2190 [Ilumatobacteraceae bacterium]|nr:hypothetical protein [Ilumatobacteraceae bacterium]
MTDGHGSAGATAVELGDVQRVLNMFADGIAGVGVQLEIVDAPHAGWPWDTTLPTGAVVRLPSSIDDFASDRENRGAYRASVLHQIGFAQFGTLAFADEDADGSASDANGSGSDLERFFARAPRPDVLREVFTMLEDLRIDAATRRHYPGAHADLDRILTVARDHHVRQPAAEPGSGSRASLLQVLRLCSLGADDHELAARGVESGNAAVIEWMLARARAVEADTATVSDTARVAVAICALLEDGDVTGAQRTYEGIVTDSPERGSGADADPSPDADGRPTDDGQPPSVGKEDHGAETAEMGGQPADVLAHERQASDEEVEAELDGRSGGRPPPMTTDVEGARIYVYDEWDYLNQTHLPAWCRVIERRLSGDDFTFIGDVRRRYSVLGSRLRRQFAFIRPTGWVRVHRSDDGDELDLDAVIEAIVDRRTGHAANERLHIRRDRAARDVATAFLVDLSASTGSAIAEPEPEPIVPVGGEPSDYRFAGAEPWEDGPPADPGRRVLDIAKESVALMCDALQLLGDSHAVYGFSGEGRDKVEFHVTKEFGDRTSPATWAALAAMKPRRYTRMGPAIRHTTAKLAAQPAKTKLLIVISDGYPQDIDYGPDRGDKEYGLQDTARALQDASDAGIATYCVTIDPAGHDYLRRMCPDQNYLVIDDVPSLPGELAKLYGTLATTSSRRPPRP